jgi:predicted nucleotidyltransferase
LTLPLTAAQKSALTDLVTALEGRPLILIGGVAVHFHTGLTWRRTSDLDLVAAIEIAELQTIVGRLKGWTRDSRIEHRWHSPAGMMDLIPASAELIREGRLRWPETGFEMNLAGMDLAFEHHEQVALQNGKELGVASLAVLVVLKMIAVLDRPPQRERDMEDVAHLLEAYLPEDDDRRFDPQIVRSGHEMADVSAYVLGQDVSAVARPNHRELIEAFLATAEDGDSWIHSRMLGIGPFSWRHEEEDPLSRRLAAFRAGFRGP